MNTFWLKIAGLAVVVVVAVVLIGVFSSSTSTTAPQPQPKPAPPKTIYEQWEKDDQRLRAEPELTEPPTTSPSGQPPAEPRRPQFKKLGLEDEIEAQRLWEWAVNQRKMGRLPVMGYKQMVDTCREIIRRWPQSEYAFLAKRALADLPEKYHQMYNITKEEMDVSIFYK